MQILLHTSWSHLSAFHIALSNVTTGCHALPLVCLPLCLHLCTAERVKVRKMAFTCCKVIWFVMAFSCGGEVWVGLSV